MKKKIIVSIVFIILAGSILPISGQIIKNNNMIKSEDNNPLINEDTWIKTYGGLGIQSGEMVQLTNDGCYIVVGDKWTGFGSSWVNDIWLIKINAMGEIIWDQIYGLDSYDWCSAVRQTSDDGFILIGFSEVTPNDNAIRLIKTDGYGAIEWVKTYLHGKVSGRQDVIQTSDGGYAIFASGGLWPEFKDYIIRTDGYGDVIWEKNISDIRQAWRGEFIKQTLDGGFIIAGCADGENHSIGMKLIKLDIDGNLLWNKSYIAKDGGLGFSVQITNDGGFVICGEYLGSIGDYSGPWLIKTDSEGELIWDSKIGKSRFEFGYSVQQTNDDGYIVAGTYSPIFTRKILLIKTDSEGQVEWRKTFDYFGSSEVYSVQQTIDGGYIAVGTTGSAINSDILIIKTDSNGDIPTHKSKIDDQRPLKSSLLRLRNMFPLFQRIMKFIN